MSDELIIIVFMLAVLATVLWLGATDPRQGDGGGCSTMPGYDWCVK